MPANFAVRCNMNGGGGRRPAPADTASSRARSVPTQLRTPRSGRKRNDVIRVFVTSAAIAAIAVMIIVAGGIHSGHAPASAPRASSAAVVTTTTRRAATTTITTTTASTTTVAPRRATPTTQHPSTKPNHHARPPAAPHRPGPPNPALVATLRAQALKNCLVLAATNNYRTIAANNTWYQNQLHLLASHPKKAAKQAKVLQIEQQQTQTEIQAEYTIDVSNCYLRWA